jgi:hypothetical protein
MSHGASHYSLLESGCTIVHVSDGHYSTHLLNLGACVGQHSCHVPHLTSSSSSSSSRRSKKACLLQSE